ncbi:MAG: HAD family acid phosphatase [Clostridiales bacterium]|jgi:ribonucleotide monophosphatase NagD (HAD superfamily)|nr:HAD family acid phosphatase [Clostridiales bacterium]
MTRKVSSLNKTWVFDIDGTIVKHNGYKLDGNDALLEGAAEFFAALPRDDMVVLITSRSEEYKAATEAFLSEKGIRFDAVIYNAPYGERILINDAKPSGLPTAIAVNTRRDEFMREVFEIDSQL